MPYEKLVFRVYVLKRYLVTILRISENCKLESQACQILPCLDKEVISITSSRYLKDDEPYKE